MILLIQADFIKIYSIKPKKLLKIIQNQTVMKKNEISKSFQKS